MMKHLLLCVTLFISFAVDASTPGLAVLPKVEGEAVVQAGIPYTYSYAGFAIAPMWEIQSGTATINNTWSSGGVQYVSITFSTSAVVLFFDEVAGGAYSTKIVTVLEPPTAPHVSICGSGTAALTATPGGYGAGVRWYAATTGGSVLSSATTYTPYVTADTTYYVETWDATSSLASSRVAVNVKVETVPIAPTSVTPASRCGEGSVTLSAVPTTGANTIIWYASVTGETTVHQGLTFATPTLTDVTGYYAASYHTVTGCLSAGRTEIVAEVFANPPPLVAWGSPIRYGSGQTQLHATANTTDRYGELLAFEIDTDVYDIFWYASQSNAENDVSRLANTLVFTTPILSANTTYYARLRDEETGCYSNVAPVTAEVVPYVTNASIRTDQIRVTGKKTEASLSTLTDGEKTTTFAYLDGVGRVQQSVVLRGSPAGKDLVLPAEYDATGRVAKQYLAYVANTTNGSFHSGYKVEQQNFFLALNDKIADDSAAYVKTRYEESPLGRVMEQGSAGKAFQPGTTHTTRAEYGFNSANEVRRFDKKGNSTEFYPANTLTRIKSTSAQNNHTVTFMDGTGRTVLTRAQVAANVEGVYTDYLETYYVYNDLGQVNFIISPKGVAELKAGNWDFTQIIKDSLSNQFRYDTKGRVIEKKVPGQAWQYIVYDPLGRVVLTQDGLLRPDNKWMFIKYDYKGNAVMTGLHTNTAYTTRADLQTYIDGIYVSGHATFGADTWYEKQGTTLHGYTNQSFPNANLDVLSVNYLDDYDFDNNGTVDASYVSEGIAGEHTVGLYTINLPTGSKRKILETSTWLYTFIFYDALGRAIQIQSTNPINTASLDRVTNAYADDGRILYTKKYHNAGTGLTYTVMNQYEYSARGDLWRVSQDNSGTGTAYQMLAQYEYNELGQLVDKKLHATVETSTQWQNAVGTSVGPNGTTLTKTSGPSQWNAGASTPVFMAQGEDGWVESRATGLEAIFGLAETTGNSSYESINYAINCAWDNNIYIFESGAWRGNFGSFATSDVFRVERVNGVVLYKKNGVTFYTSAIASTTALRADVSLYHAGSALSDIKTSGGGTALQSIDYRYTINGQLASINNASLDASGKANDDTNDYFGMELLYNGTESGLTTTQRYDGMVSAIKWKGAGGGSGTAGQKSYVFTYDNTGRLGTASYRAKDASWDKEVGAQNESMTYDHNGNIKSLTRAQRKHQLAGLTGSYTNETIDNLTYEYAAGNKNSLKKITDAASTSAAAGFDNGASSTNTDYKYDVNGNLLSDKNKGITSIVYNFLGKPTQVNFTGGKRIEYVYDAGGNKLTQKLYHYDTLKFTTDYVNGFVYEKAGAGASTLSFFGSPEGRVVNNSGTLTYEYSIADHQGNTRVVFTSAAPAPVAPETNFENNSAGFMNFPSGGTLNGLEVFDHDASTATSKSTILNGGYSSQVGVTKTFKVYPGDKVKAEAYAKYRNASSSTSNLSGFALMLTGAFGVSSVSTGEALKAYNTLNTYGGQVAAGIGHGSEPGDPKAFVTILLFDKNYNFLDAAWDQIDADYEQTSALTTKDPFDYLTKEVTVKEEGFAYVFISNESPTFVDVYFDDVKFTHTPSNVIQYNEYYPFGLQTSSSWTRENTKENNYLYNAANELNKTNGWYEMFYRGYDPAIGRMLQVDPYASMYASVSTYNYALNNPACFNDPNGGQVSAVGYTDSQLRTMYRNDRYSGGYSDFGDWASDNLDGFGMGGRIIDGTFGQRFSLGENGQVGRLALFEYTFSYSDGVQAEYLTFTRWEVVTDDPDLVINNYGVLPPDNVWGGIGVDFTYKNSKKYKDVRWVQTIWTNSPAKGAKSPYNDPAPPDGDDLPFFWDEDENYLHVDYDGTNASFRDNPRRPIGENSYWLAELSVVSKQSDGSYAAITTITYGFRIQDGKVQPFGIARDVVPSAFHQNSFNTKR